MSLEEQFNQVMNSTGEEMEKIITTLTPTEQKYINARIIVMSLESDLQNLNESKPWRDVLYIKKQICDWKEIVQELESQQHLALS